MRALAAHADRLLAFNGWQGAETVALAAVPQEEDLVAMVRDQNQPKKQQKKFQKSGGGQMAGGQQVASPSPAQVARQAANLCMYHLRFGEKARECRPHCFWQGN